MRMIIVQLFLGLEILAAVALGQSLGDTMTPNMTLTDGKTLVSSGGIFALGFLSLGSSTRKYLGIWYHNIPIQTAIWVANGATPLDSSAAGMLQLNENGNLILSDRSKTIFWSTGTSNAKNPVLQLLDSGNLVLTAGSFNSVQWQSFDHLCNTYLVNMKLGVNFRANVSWQLTSWKSDTDPSPGEYYWRLETHGVPELYIGKGSTRIFRNGPWNGHGFDGNPLNSNGMFNVNFVTNRNEAYYMASTVYDSLPARLVLNTSGAVQALLWSAATNEWSFFRAIPTDPCDDYARCGINGICNLTYSPFCQCIPGYAPVSQDNWDQSQYSDGCEMQTVLNCSTDGFWALQNIKLPDTTNATADSNKNLNECRDWCLKNCSCSAYAVTGGTGCLTWRGDLVDLRFYVTDASVLYVRLAASELAGVSRHKKGGGSKRTLIIIVSVIVSVTLLLSCSLIWLLRIRRQKYRGVQKHDDRLMLALGTNIAIDLGESDKGADFKVFSFSDIANATENFSPENKLGQGGFGPVYKGQLQDGQEIAVKRLSARSGQGLLEFRNEIVLIAKLQHRNLVRLLGCCIEEEEKILVYEYMPNKSLDYFLFDATRRTLLDWHRRFHIIEGIAQGILYLHKHSRLRIIHRDLKASNILLDSEMNPKISDFGMARIFGTNEAQGNTNRVVGTYGYMSPEYAAEGLFSIKSDVFSFGVLLLEIISGKKNSGYHQYGNYLNLLGYAWETWKQGSWSELVDPSLGDDCPSGQISRCIHVGLMCVQENASDRPTMSDILSMLTNENAAIPDPKQPAFFTVRITADGELPSEPAEYFSLNEATITAIQGR